MTLLPSAADLLLRSLSLDALRGFERAARLQSFTAAADDLNLSQSAVSKAVSALEKRLGVQLLHRSTRSVTLTDHGRRYHDRMKPLLEDLVQADGELMSSAQELSGLVTVAASSTFGRLHVLPLVPRLLALHPRLRLDLQLSDSVQDLLAEGVDLAIRISPSFSPDAVVKRVANTTVPCPCAPTVSGTSHPQPGSSFRLTADASSAGLI